MNKEKFQLQILGVFFYHSYANKQFPLDLASAFSYLMKLKSQIKSRFGFSRLEIGHFKMLLIQFSPF